MNPEENKENIPLEKKPIKALRTFAGDVEEALSKNKSSAATIMIAEQKRREERPELAPPTISKQTKNTTFFVLGSTLLLLGIIAIGVVYYIKSSEKINTDQKTKTLISFTQEKTIPIGGLTKDQIYSKIASEKTSFSLPANSVLYLNLTDSQTNPETIEKILKTLTPNAPDELVRSLGSRYMFGVYSFDTNEPFIILEVTDYTNSYPAMLRWEKDMVKDLSVIFSIPPSVFGMGFVDEEYKNKDLRVLRNLDNKSILLYSFIDKNTIVITANENILSAILGKYIISKQSR